jgi:hypothetical protein
MNYFNVVERGGSKIYAYFKKELLKVRRVGKSTY